MIRRKTLDLQVQVQCHSICSMVIIKDMKKNRMYLSVMYSYVNYIKSVLCPYTI